MGKSKKSQNEKKKINIKISKRYKAAINIFESKAYCHLNDGVKKKYISFDLNSAKKIAKKMSKIVEKMKNEQEKADHETSSASDSSEDSD